MTNHQSKTEERLQKAFSHLDLADLGFSHYRNIITQAMIKEACFEASRPCTPADQVDFYDNKQHDYCRVLNFLNELEAIAQNYKEHEPA